MRILVLACGAVLAAMVPALAGKSGNCTNADPTGELSTITGDFQLALDPQDSAQHVLFLSNLSKESTTPQNIVVAQLDGVTGILVPTAPTVVADNFLGSSQMNGPRWIYTPQGQLGIIYVGSGGVHGGFRSSQPTAWNSFPYNYNESANSGSPSVLPNTSSGAYPGATGGPPSEMATYPQYDGACTSLCYGAYNGGVVTDVSVALTQFGYTAEDSTQGVLDGSLVMSACTASSACGLFQGKIDGAGGFSSFKQIAATGSVASPSLAVAQHPVTGTTVVFTAGSGSTVNVWQQATNGAPLSLIGAVPVPSGAIHYRASTSNTEVVLNFIIRNGSAVGNYTIPVSAIGTTLTVGSSNRISLFAGGTDLQWFPAAAQWAFYYRKTTTGKEYTRCWVIP